MCVPSLPRLSKIAIITPAWLDGREVLMGMTAKVPPSAAGARNYTLMASSFEVDFSSLCQCWLQAYVSTPIGLNGDIASSSNFANIFRTLGGLPSILSSNSLPSTCGCLRSVVKIHQ